MDEGIRLGMARAFRMARDLQKHWCERCPNCRRLGRMLERVGHETGETLEQVLHRITGGVRGAPKGPGA